MKANTEKAMAACAEYVRASDEVRRLTREIGNALLGCRYDADQYSENPRTHLADYYADRNAEGAIGPFFVGRVKSQDAFEACPSCVAANKLVQQRKDAKQKLGAAKRQITKLGRAA